MRYDEIKRHLDGREERYTLRLVLRTAHVAVAEYGFKRSYERDGFSIPRGSKAYGFFWRRRPYIMYRMLGPTGELIAHRFDVVEDVRLRDNAVTYTDLFLDLWVGPDGLPQFEDDEEVEEALAAGVITAGQAANIARVGEILQRRYKIIIREGARLVP